MIRAFIFDFDGTLVESNDVKRSAFFAVTEGIAGAAPILERILAQPDCGDRYDIFEKLVGELDDDKLDAGRLVDAYGAFCEREILDLLKTPRVMPLLDGLKTKGYALFIASATPEVDLVPLVAESPFAKLFDAVCGRPRSKAAILRDICQTHGWSPDQVIMVGDGMLDSQGTVEFGCRFIGVDVDALAQPAFLDRMLDVAGGNHDRWCPGRTVRRAIALLRPRGGVDGSSRNQACRRAQRPGGIENDHARSHRRAFGGGAFRQHR